MRTPKVLAASLAVMLAAAGLAGVAQAQTFFQKVFGIGGASAPVPATTYTRPQTIPPSRFYRRYGRGVQTPYQSRPAYRDEADDDIGPPDSGGPYRTMCVRTCDGFYFPLRHNARHKNFASDVKSCRAGCGSDARLFYYPLYGGSVDTMSDLAGRKYAELPHAFAYRKALVQGCACKPVPWSEEAAGTHRKYAEIEAAELAKDKAFVVAKAANSEPVVAPATEAAAASEPPSLVSDANGDGEADVTTAEPTVETTPAPVTEAAPAVVPSSEGPAPRKRSDRRHRTVVQKAQFKPASWSLGLGGGKSKYVWPGDPQ